MWTYLCSKSSVSIILSDSNVSRSLLSALDLYGRISGYQLINVIKPMLYTESVSWCRSISSPIIGSWAVISIRRAFALFIRRSIERWIAAINRHFITTFPRLIWMECFRLTLKKAFNIVSVIQLVVTRWCFGALIASTVIIMMRWNFTQHYRISFLS